MGPSRNATTLSKRQATSLVVARLLDHFGLRMALVRGMSSAIVAPLLVRLDMPASRDSRDRRMEFSATGE